MALAFRGKGVEEAIHVHSYFCFVFLFLSGNKNYICKGCQLKCRQGRALAVSFQQ